MKKLMLALLMLNLVGCAFGAGTDDEQRNEVERKEELQRNYAQIVGTYKGTVTISGKTSDLQLFIYTVDVESGKNQLGEPQIIPILYAKYRNVSDFAGERLMKARYLSANGDFSAVNDGNFNMRGTVFGGTIRGEIMRPTGFYGSFELTKATDPQSGPNDGDDQEYREFVRRELKKVTGVYTGTVSNPGGTPYPVQVELRTEERYSNGGNVWSIALTAIYVRKDYDPSLTRRMMAVSYDPTMNPATLSLLSEGTFPGSTIPNSNYMNIVGTIANGKITAEMSDHRGYQGTLNATR